MGEGKSEGTLRTSEQIDGPPRSRMTSTLRLTDIYILPERIFSQENQAVPISTESAPKFG
jgi:hypothetical protein